METWFSQGGRAGQEFSTACRRSRGRGRNEPFPFPLGGLMERTIHVRNSRAIVRGVLRTTVGPLLLAWASSGCGGAPDAGTVNMPRVKDAATERGFGEIRRSEDPQRPPRKNAQSRRQT